MTSAEDIANYRWWPMTVKWNTQMHNVQMTDVCQTSQSVQIVWMESQLESITSQPDKCVLLDFDQPCCATA